MVKKKHIIKLTTTSAYCYQFNSFGHLCKLPLACHKPHQIQIHFFLYLSHTKIMYLSLNPISMVKYSSLFITQIRINVANFIYQLHLLI